MSQENVEIFRRAQEAYNEGDWDAALAAMDPNVVFDSTRAGPDGEIYRGYEGAKRFWRMLRDVFGSLRNEPEEIIDNGDRLFTRIRQRSTGRASGAVTEDVIYQIITIDKGKAIRVEFFRDRAEALEAAGLSEQAMSQENVEIVREYFETVNTGDFAQAMRYYADDVELVVPAEAFLEAGTFRGKDAVGLWFGNWFRAFQRGYQFELDEIREVGDAVFVSARHHGRGKASGAEVRSTIAYLFRVGDGHIGKVELFSDRRSALEAVGLSERPPTDF